MAQIYKIVNSVNGKVYIGKTEQCFKKRFKQHCLDSKKDRCEKRPLYSAMRKYGIDKFSVELICETNTPEADEIRLIAEYGSYSYGYNATMGGDGKKRIDIDESSAVKMYCDQLNTTAMDVAVEFGISVDTMRAILKARGVVLRRSSEYTRRAVKQYSKDGEFIRLFQSAIEAAKSLGRSDASHISACVRGKRKSAYGFIWK